MAHDVRARREQIKAATLQLSSGYRSLQSSISAVVLVLCVASGADNVSEQNARWRVVFLLRDLPANATITVGELEFYMHSYGGLKKYRKT